MVVGLFVCEGLLVNGVYDHDVATRLSGDVCWDGAEESAGEGVDASVAYNEEVGVVFLDDFHECVGGGAWAGGGFYFGCA